MSTTHTEIRVMKVLHVEVITILATKAKIKTRTPTYSKRSHICMLCINLRFVCYPIYTKRKHHH